MIGNSKNRQIEITI